MDYSETNYYGTDFISFPLIIGNSTDNSTDNVTATVPWGTTAIIVEDKDWMPYHYFEYDPVWHKKFAAIKCQMCKMWD